MPPNEAIRSRQKFWLIVGALILLVITGIIIKNPRPRCLEYKKEDYVETYYDFSESGQGVWQQGEVRLICVKWDSTPSK